MKFLREYYSLTWWQMGLFKVYLFVGGLVLGAYFAEYVSKAYIPLIVVFAVLAGYFTYAWIGDRI